MKKLFTTAIPVVLLAFLISSCESDQNVNTSVEDQTAPPTEQVEEKEEVIVETAEKPSRIPNVLPHKGMTVAALRLI